MERPNNTPNQFMLVLVKTIYDDLCDYFEYSKQLSKRHSIIKQDIFDMLEVNVQSLMKEIADGRLDIFFNRAVNVSLIMERTLFEVMIECSVTDPDVDLAEIYSEYNSKIRPTIDAAQGMIYRCLSCLNIIQRNCAKTIEEPEMDKNLN